MENIIIFICISLILVLLWIRNIETKLERKQLNEIRLFIKVLQCDLKSNLENYLYHENSWDTKGNKSRYDFAKKICDMDPDNDIRIGKNSAYTKNKRIIYIQTIHGSVPVDKQILLFVTLHELAHVGNGSYGHDKEFWENFKWLLKRAISLGIINISNLNRKQKYIENDIGNLLIDDHRIYDQPDLDIFHREKCLLVNQYI